LTLQEDREVKSAGDTWSSITAPLVGADRLGQEGIYGSRVIGRGTRHRILVHLLEPGERQRREATHPGGLQRNHQQDRLPFDLRG
jgi:hypothetical protein